MTPLRSPQNQDEDQEIINLLKDLGALKSEYPPELFAARRAAFVAQVEQLRNAKVQHSSKEQFIKRLKLLSSTNNEYPPELLSARREVFIAQIEQLTPVEVKEELSSMDQAIIKLFGNLKSVETEYPP